MYILVKTLTGVSNAFENIESCSQLQNNISEKMGISVDEQTLLFQNQILNKSNFGIINDNAEVYLKISLEGGAKKKKKKEVKKTKKKHVHKKINLAVFKHYKIENENKVIRLRQMCKVCPPGTFLAEHENRLYCGRCRTAYAKIVDAKGGKGKGDKGKGEKGGKKDKGKKEKK